MSEARAVLSLSARVTLRRTEGDTIDVTGKAAVLLALTAVEGEVERGRAARLLWPDSRESQARNNLRTLIHRLNQRFGAELLIGADRIAIDVRKACIQWPDSAALLAALEAAGPPGCELLGQAGVDADASEGLCEWLQEVRQRRRRQQQGELSAALEQAMADGEHGRAVALARACVQLEPLSEHWHRQLMDTLARCGDRAAALAAYEDCKARLRDQLGVLPDLQTRTVQLRILQGAAQQRPATAVVAGLTALGGSARYPLVERDDVLAAAGRALARRQHVVLQGEAGVGKTRLLRQLAGHADTEQVVIRAGTRAEPYSALAQMLQALMPRRPVRIGVPEQIELARLAPLAFPNVQPSHSALSPPRLHAAVRHWLARLADSGVRLLVLDDLHYADSASQSAWADLLRPQRAGEPAIPTMLLAHRTGEVEATLSEALDAAAAAGQACPIALQRLSLRGVKSLLKAIHAQHEEAQAEQLLQRTGGNPLFVIELARTGQAPAAGPGIAATAIDLGALLRSRLAGCSSAARQLASVAAVAASDFSVELAAAVTGELPLSLMAPWSELQQRGLFADHGLAHDLVRDAVLEALPFAIRRSVHRQTAAYLEEQGQQGARVLAHWLAGEDPDRALAHAVQQMHSASAAGLSTIELEVGLLGLLERVGDAVLLDNLWWTAEIGGSRGTVPDSADVWTRLERLVARVRPLSTRPEHRAWMAFETARVLDRRDRHYKQAYDTLSEAARDLPESGYARAQCELALAYLAEIGEVVDGAFERHVRDAMRAAVGLTGQLRYRRLCEEISLLYGLVDSTGALRLQSARLRSARRRGDRGVVADARAAITFLLRRAGYHRQAFRHGTEEARASGRHGATESRIEHELMAFCALGCDRYREVQALIDSQTGQDGWRPSTRSVLEGMLLLRLGQWEPLRQLIERHSQAAEAGYIGDLFNMALLRTALARHDGIEHSPYLQHAYDAMQARGVGGAVLALAGWELSIQRRSARDRLDEGTRLLDVLSRSPEHEYLRPIVALQLAEAHALADPHGGEARALALRAARSFRRGQCPVRIYVPDGLVRCARLIETTDPAEASSLMHVARRWVLEQALPNVPPHAVHGFLAIPVNRLLTSESA